MGWNIKLLKRNSLFAKETIAHNLQEQFHYSVHVDKQMDTSYHALARHPPPLKNNNTQSSMFKGHIHSLTLTQINRAHASHGDSR